MLAIKRSQPRPLILIPRFSRHNETAVAIISQIVLGYFPCCESHPFIAVPLSPKPIPGCAVYLYLLHPSAFHQRFNYVIY